MSVLEETRAIRPGQWRRWLWPVLLPLLTSCLIFGAAALWGRQRWYPQDVMLLGAFLLGALLLGGASVVVVLTMWRLPSVTMTLAPVGLTLEYLPEPGTIPWSNVEAFGVVRDDWTGQTVGLRLRSYEGMPAHLMPTLEAWRQARGYDVQVPRRVLDRSVDEFCELLAEYLEHYGTLDQVEEE